jgi:hypothetical protein
VKEDCVEVLKEVSDEDVEGFELDDDALQEAEVEEDTDSAFIPAQALDARAGDWGSSSGHIDVGQCRRKCSLQFFRVSREL